MIVYIHGFNSSGNGSKYTELSAMFPDIEIYSPSYDSSDFHSIEPMIDEIENKIKNEKNVLFIGCSLGGYLSQYLANKFNRTSILLNPCYDPTYFLSKMLGENTLYDTGTVYELTKENIAILSTYHLSSDDRKNIRISVFVNTDDDVIPYKGVMEYYHDRLIKMF